MTYEAGNKNSFFRDLHAAYVKKDPAAIERLERHRSEMAELGFPSSDPEIIPPQWLRIARAD